MSWTMRNFDTLESFEQLKNAGVSDKQARVFVKMVEASINASIENLATKADLLITKSDLKADIAEVRTEIAEVRTEIADLRTELKGDIAELRIEVKADNAALRSDINVLNSGMILMQRLFFGGIVSILLGMVVLFLHH